MREVLPDHREWRGVLEAAALAPSVLNTQPWLFDLHPDHVDLHANADRQLRVLDRRGRQLLMSCGAGLMNLRLALLDRSFEPDVTLLPDKRNTRHVASVRIGRTRTPTAEEQTLYAAIPNRRTNRRPFSTEDPPAEALGSLHVAAQKEGAEFTVLDGTLRTKAVRAVHDAENKLRTNPAVQQELARWIAPEEEIHEGIPTAALAFVPHDDRAMVRDFATAAGQDDRPTSAYERHPTLALISTETDEPVDWIRAGQALERVHLTATHLGLALSYLGQPFEIGDRDWAHGPRTGISGVAQMMMRIGYAPPSPAVPRRPVEEMVVAGRHLLRGA
jgi:Nitroreductase family